MWASTYRHPGLRLAAATLASAYLAAALWYSRFHILDDALIHLRLAEMYLEHGFFTADGQAKSFGTSSPGFVLITAALHALIRSDLTTKIISVCCYLGLVAALIGLAVRSGTAARYCWGALAFLAMSPIGIRWLTDGMETSLAAAIAVLLGIAATRVRTATPLMAICLCALGAVAVATRLEMTLLVALAALTIALRARAEASTSSARQLAAIPIALGGAAGLLFIWLSFNAILPDPALAKATGEAAPTASLFAVVSSLASGMGFGAGLVALWMSGLAANLLLRTAPRAAIVVPNLALALLWCVIAIRGQYVQGIRHVLPAMVFMIAANATLLARADLSKIARQDWPYRAWAPWVAGTSIAVCVAAFAAELEKFHTIVENRTAAFLDMRALDLAALEGTNGIGWDVGHLMYFTKGQVCDVSGLVNGRQAAAARETARLENCLKRDVEFVFVTLDNAAELIERSGTRFADWPVCGQYLFQNVGATLPHYLAVSPSRAAQICPRQRDEGLLKRAALHPS
jgi:hypothetical protein